jgi:hypothetical protein
MSEKEDIGCLEYNGKYLIVTKDGFSKILYSKEEYEEYLKNRNTTKN